MRKVSVLLVILLSAIYFMGCGVGKKQKTSELFKVIEEGYGPYGVAYHVKLKNISQETLNGRIDIYVECKDGTSETNFFPIINMKPKDIQEFSIYNEPNKTYNVSSWSIVD